MIKENLKQCFILYTLSTLVLAVQFMTYMGGGNSIAEIMDTEGWVFFAASCVSHASQIALVPFALGTLLVACRCGRKVSVAVQTAGMALLFALNYLNMQVYSIYRFHINGFVLSMVFGDSAAEIFTFSTALYLKEALALAGMAAMAVGLYMLSAVVWKRFGRRFSVWAVAGSFIGCTLFAHLWHIYAAFYQHQSVMKSATLLPYYFPTTANRFMLDRGFEPPYNHGAASMAHSGGDVRYPVAPLNCVRPDSLPNVVLILIDSWNKRTFTPECTPNIHTFAQSHLNFDNHRSCSNGTRSSVFGIFFGLSCYYWESFEPAAIQPLLVDRLQSLGYHFQAYPAAPFADPPFARVLFRNVKGLNVKTEGKTVLDRDTRITDMFLADMEKNRKSGQPFFSFLFYDLPHSFELPKDKNTRFSPAWDYADYTSLDNNIDSEPFFNLYRNCVYQDDIQIGRVLASLKEKGMMENTVVIITGDHGQEFNENRRNYWGHNSNFSVHQTGVPLICHLPDVPEPAHFSHRTTHYDFVPTLMQRYLGVNNPMDDYSTGMLLTDTTSRRWHVMGSNLNYAFLVDGDTIIEKKAEGSMDVYTSDMKPVADYSLDAKAFGEAMKRLNRFFK